MVGIAQLVRASGCGPEGRRFEPDYSPQNPADKRLPDINLSVTDCLKFFQKSLKKLLTNGWRYAIISKLSRERERHTETDKRLRKTSKKFEKPLDKPNQM